MPMGKEELGSRKGRKIGNEVLNLWFQANVGSRTKWQVQEQRSWDFYLNAQLTEKERSELEEAGMPTFIINRITPIIETMKYFVTARNPKWRAVGVKGDDVRLANIVTDLMDYSWYISGGKAILSSVVTNALVRGKGYIHIKIDPDADRGLGEVIFESIDPFEVWVSPMTRDPYERDAMYHIIKKDLPRHVLMDALPEYASIIRRIKAGITLSTSLSSSERDFTEESAILPQDEEPPPTADGGYDDVLPYFEVYMPVNLKYYRLYINIPPGTDEAKMMAAKIDQMVNQFAEEKSVEFEELQISLERQLQAGEILKERYEFEVRKASDEIAALIQEYRDRLTQEFEKEMGKIEERFVPEEEYELLKRQLGNNIKEAIPYFERRIKKICSIGDRALYEAILPISHSPIIAIPYNHTGTPYAMSAVTPLIGKQQEINKSHQIMVHHANLSSNLRWKYIEGEIDEDLWQNYAASPQALLPYRQGFSPDGPVPIMPLPINNAFFTVEQDSKTDLEYMAGIQPPVMGIASGREETYRGFLAKDEFSTRRIRSWVNNIFEPFLEHVGRVWLQFAREHYTFRKIFRIVEPNDMGGWEEREHEINIPLYDDKGKLIGRVNDYASMKYDIRILSGSTLPLNRWMQLEEYKEWYQLGIIDDIAFLSKADIPDKEDIIERNSIYSKMKSTIDQLEKELKDKEGKLQTLERQLIQAGIKGKVAMADKEVDRSKTETKMMQKLVQERMRDELKMMRSEIGKEIEKLRAELRAQKRVKK